MTENLNGTLQDFGKSWSNMTENSTCTLQDFGKSWLNMTENSKGAIASFWDFDWGARLHRGKKNSYPDETIFATAYENADHMKGPYPGWDKDIHFVMSHDFFSSAHTRVASCGNQFELVGHMVRYTFLSCMLHDDPFIKITWVTWCGAHFFLSCVLHDDLFIKIPRGVWDLCRSMTLLQR
jgi:hypothetical protein